MQQLIHMPAAPRATPEQIAQARDWLDDGAQPSWHSIAHESADLDVIRVIAKRFLGHCTHVILCGTGGSSLSARALIDLINYPLHLHDHDRLQLHLLDSTDPELMQAALGLPPEKTGWLFISRSGETLETLSQFFACIHRAGHRHTACLQAIALPGENSLRKLSLAHNVPIADHAATIGGRYAFFSNVGMLPAAILGYDIQALRAGAATMLSDAGIAMALEAAHWHLECMAKDYLTHVMLPYHARLYGWTYWYRQLWAESLGKNNTGTTPLIGLAPLDQHSMLQLLLDGPRDKSITTLRVAAKRATRVVPNLQNPIAPEDKLAFIATLDGADIIEAQAVGTTQSFLKRGIPVRELHLPDLREESIGALFMQQMLETVFTAKLLGVNPYDQPAVEESKALAMAYLRGVR